MKILLYATAVFLSFTHLRSQSHLPSWQQSVHYWIDAELDTDQHLLFGREKILYTNLSPDTLDCLYFHLFINAFQKGSQMQAFQEERDAMYGGSVISYLPERLLGYERISAVKNDKGEPLDFEIDDTTLKIFLTQPISPNGSVTLSMDFEVKIPLLIRRMGRHNREGVDYTLAQWYPKVCAYDQNGWNTDPYLGKEFYGEFATYDVSITLPQQYVVGATGRLQNAVDIAAMMKTPPELTIKDRVMAQERIDSNFARDQDELEMVLSSLSKLAKNNPLLPVMRTWVFHADNVHDFAWCADPDYGYEQAEWKGKKIHFLYLPDVKEQWKEMKSWTIAMMQYMSDHVGPYPYDDFTIAQAGDGGMEYPSIVFITGRRGRFSLASVTAHEVAHNWFYAALANDETREAWLDEGMTSYYTTRLMEHLFGRFANIEYDSPFKQKHFPKQDARINTYIGYQWWTKQGFEQKILTPSDRFTDDQSYLYSAYYKGEIVMFALEYYFGLERFDELMRRYFQNWKLHHVSTHGFKRFLEEVTGADLDRFFEDWVGTTKVCDYSIAGYSEKWIHDSTARYNDIKIELERRGGIAMPLDVYVKLKNGEWHGFRIPTHNNDPDIEGLERRPIWFPFEKKYDLLLELNDRIDHVVLDTTQLLPDVFRMNNRSGFVPLEWHFQKPVPYAPTLNTYLIEHRPSLWYNAVDGLRLGYRFKGKWETDEHQTLLGLYSGTASQTPDFELSYSTPLYELGSQTRLNASTYRLEGRTESRLALSRRLFNRFYNDPPFQEILVGVKAGQLFDSDYLPRSIGWEKGWVNTIFLSWSYQPNLYQSSLFQISLESSMLASEWDFSKVQFSYTVPLVLKKNYLTLESRVFAGYGTGNIPTQDQFYLSAASPRQMFNDKFYRSRGTLPAWSWQRQSDATRHVYYDGEGSMSGYHDANISGRRIWANNFNIYFINPFKLLTEKNFYVLSESETYFFADGGLVWNRDKELKKNLKDLYRMDAGWGFKYTPVWIPSWWGNYTLQFEFPVWVSDPKANNKNSHWAWRWVIGLDHHF